MICTFPFVYKLKLDWFSTIVSQCADAALCFVVVVINRVHIQETLLSYGPAAKESQLAGVIRYKDTPGQHDKRIAANKGFTSRKALTAQSKYVQLMGKHLDLFCQEKYLLNHVDLKINLRRSRDVFALIADADNYKIKFKDLVLFVRNA